MWQNYGLHVFRVAKWTTARQPRGLSPVVVKKSTTAICMTATYFPKPQGRAADTQYLAAKNECICLIFLAAFDFNTSNRPMHNFRFTPLITPGYCT